MINGFAFMLFRTCTAGQKVNRARFPSPQSHPQHLCLPKFEKELKKLSEKFHGFPWIKILPGPGRNLSGWAASFPWVLYAIQEIWLIDRVWPSGERIPGKQEKRKYVFPPSLTFRSS